MNTSRSTKQKKLIASLMYGNRTHPTADEIYELARERDPHISRGTVYRNLNLMSDTGELLRLQTPDGPSHFDSNVGEHYHFLCRKCRRVYDLPKGSRIIMNIPENEMNGFITEGQNVLLTGLCPGCNNKNN